MPRIAIAQVGSIMYDTKATIEKLRQYTKEAASGGAEIVVFPEAFIGGYPKTLTFGVSLGKRTEEGRNEFARYYESAIEYESPEADEIAYIARTHSVILVVGVVEHDGGTLYCSVFFFDQDGVRLGKHRKVMPTALERCIWGFGDGSTLPVISTTCGKIGAAICWENYMPLLRVNYYNKGIQIYFAPTVDDRDSWPALMQTIAAEGRCYVVSACQFFTTHNFPIDHKTYTDSPEVLIRGGSCAYDPLGNAILTPNHDGEFVKFIDVDLGQISRAKFDLDVVGHYSRPDIFKLIVREELQSPVVYSSPSSASVGEE